MRSWRITINQSRGGSTSTTYTNSRCASASASRRTASRSAQQRAFLQPTCRTHPGSLIIGSFGRWRHLRRPSGPRSRRSAPRLVPNSTPCSYSACSARSIREVHAAPSPFRGALSSGRQKTLDLSAPLYVAARVARQSPRPSRLVAIAHAGASSVTKSRSRRPLVTALGAHHPATITERTPLDVLRPFHAMPRLSQ